MKQKLAPRLRGFFLFMVILGLTLGLGMKPGVGSAMRTDPGPGKEIDFREWGASFQLPSDKWLPIPNQQSGKTIFSYQRDGLVDKAGAKIQANICFTFEKVAHIDNSTYSAQLQTQIQFKIKRTFTADGGLITLKNGVGYIGTSKDQSGTEHTIILVHALSSGKGMQVMMDVPSKFYPWVQAEFNIALKSIQFQ